MEFHGLRQGKLKVGQMKLKNAAIVAFLSSAIGVAGANFSPVCSAMATGQAQDAAQPAISRRLGTIKAINGDAITLTSDTGEITVTVQPSARILRIAAGEKDLKNATPIQVQDLKVGETIRVRGSAGDDGESMAALEVLAISASTVGAVRQEISQDWQKRGIGGIVSAVDAGTGTVTISTSSLGGKKTVVVHTSKSTAIRRYAPDSAKSEDAKPSTLQNVHVGDQLRARGDRSPDGNELAAEEIFAGNFPNVDGLIKSVDASAGVIVVQDVISKKDVQLKINGDSQLHKIPAEMANRFAMRLKAGGAAGAAGAGAAGANGQNGQQQGASNGGAANGAAPGAAAPAGTTPGNGGAGGYGGGRSGGGFDFQRLLDQTPAVALADLHKGDAVAILATEGSPSGGSAVVKLFSGVEPILQAAPSGSQATMLSPWNLGGAPGGEAGAQ